MNNTPLVVKDSALYALAVLAVKGGYRGEIIIQADFAKEVARFINEMQSANDTNFPAVLVGTFGTMAAFIIAGPLAIMAGATATTLALYKASADVKSSRRLPYADLTETLFSKGYRIALNRGSTVILTVQSP